ncbi:hypothetical protein NBH19_06965 [Rhizobium sp. S95]|uniref:Uncharacterized protein n=1 Tax=Ciceribacter sichuanensis TaxID=2949647 RepID=A0AAJ1C1Y3_9HYPH|nr:MULTISPECIES: hypothetical protein [unclassified Ciceribacter]MCM2395824.1 hypothetical protein [Ciceribacter sp. S95]MCO5960045.1 hypothetical protein [Ciceribacter sp. S101]
MQAKAGAGSLSSAVNRSSLRALSLGENNRIDPKKADVLRLNIGSSRDDACIVHTLGAVGQVSPDQPRSNDVNRFRSCPIRPTASRQFSRISMLTIHGLPA